MNSRRSANLISNFFIIPKNKPIEYIGNYDDDGLKNGFGILKWSNGTLFKGYFNNDHINGWGIIIYNNQNIFKGRFSNDKANGFGYYLYKNGKKKIGYWINDILSGIGYEFDDNEYYSGEFQNSEKNGLGIIKSKNNDNILYEGEIKNNNYHGFGIKYYDDGSIYNDNWNNKTLSVDNEKERL